MLSPEWLSAFAPVGSLQKDGSWSAAGAGVFFYKPPVVWLVTAAHVADAVPPDMFTALVNRSSTEGIVVIELAQIIKAHGLSWVRDPSADLAAVVMPISPEFVIKAISADNCLPVEQLVPSMSCYTLGCPWGLAGVDPSRATPLVLDGVISGINKAKDRIFVSTPTFPGNSGGPLVAIRSPFSPAGSLHVGKATVLLAGIMLQTVTVFPPDQDSGPPLRLGAAVPAARALALISSDDALQQQGRALATANA